MMLSCSARICERSVVLSLLLEFVSCPKRKKNLRQSPDGQTPLFHRFCVNRYAITSIRTADHALLLQRRMIMNINKMRASMIKHTMESKAAFNGEG